MIYIPVIKNLPVLQYSIVYLDEAQDASKASIELFLKMKKENGRVIIASDPYQNIYFFQSASKDSFEKLKFNELYASEDWLKNNYPKADVVAMMLNDFSINNIINNIGKYPKINNKDIPYQEDESYDNMLRDRDITLKNKNFN